MNFSTAIITALKTPFTISGKIDFAAFEKLLLRQLNSGISGFVVAGTTGDGCFLSEEEMTELIRITRSIAGKEAPIIGATSSLSTRDMIQLTERGFQAGMSASLQLPPYYIRPGASAVIEHLEAALEVGPGIIYHHPGRTGVFIEEKEMQVLATHKNFLGVKECAGIERTMTLHRNNIRVWSGNDSTALEEIKLGAALGVISVVSNIAPHSSLHLFSQQEDSFGDCFKNFISLLGELPNPVGISTAMAMAGLTAPILWRPYQETNLENQKKMLPLLVELASREQNIEKPALIDREEWCFI